MSFSDEIISELKQPLLAELVSTREAFGGTVLSYLASHSAIDVANKIFGYGMWGKEILTLREVNRLEYIKPKYNSDDTEKPMVSVTYMCTLRLTVKVGDETVVYEDCGSGVGVGAQTGNGFASAIDLASKASVTDGMKRCLRHFGSRFGNDLYEKDGDAPVTTQAYEASKIVDADAIKALYHLADTRGVDAPWIEAWLIGEGWHDPVGDLRVDWYNLVYQAVDNVGRAEREAEAYESDIENVIKLMSESVNINMLKGLFSEAYKKVATQKDKERLVTVVKLYEELKLKFAEKK